MLKRNFVYNVRNAFNQNRFQYFFRDLAIIFIKRIKKISIFINLTEQTLQATNFYAKNSIISLLKITFKCNTLSEKKNSKINS